MTIPDDLFARPILVFQNETGDLNGTTQGVHNVPVHDMSRIAEIESTEDFPANVSWLCDWCLYKSICPMWKHEVELEGKPENEYLNDPGLKLVDAYAELKEKLDSYRKNTEEELEKIREALIAFCEKKGVEVVAGSENKISVKEYETIRLPGKNSKERAELIDKLKKLGRLEEVSSFNTYALTKILDKKEWKKDELVQLEKFWTAEKNYRLTVGKK